MVSQNLGSRSPLETLRRPPPPPLTCHVIYGCPPNIDKKKFIHHSYNSSSIEIRSGNASRCFNQPNCMRLCLEHYGILNSTVTRTTNQCFFSAIPNFQIYFYTFFRTCVPPTFNVLHTQ